MIKYISKEFSEAETPQASEEWKNKSSKDRIDVIIFFIL